MPAPGRFSITTDWPFQRAVRKSARMRATTSVGPPAANGTSSFTGRVGNSAVVCAAAAPTTAPSNKSWPAPGSEDTELGVILEPEVVYGTQ